MKPQRLTQRQHPLFSVTALGATLMLFVILGFTLYQFGGQAFNPGDLSTIAVSQQQSGEFMHHAEFGNDCTYCHEPFAGVQAELCEACHTTIGTQRQQQTGLHGRIPTHECALCHQEHQGATHDLYTTALAQFNEQHHAYLFVLDGAHQLLTCEACHQNNQFVNTPSQCAGCHMEPAIHRGLLGTDCVRCHTTQAWRPTQLTHHTFPLDHGDEGQIPCATCHQTTFTVYSCEDCHTTTMMTMAHEGVSAFTLQDCVTCHTVGTIDESIAIQTSLSPEK